MKCLDLFAGGGGASLGLHRAGYDVLGVEWDAEAAQHHRDTAGPCLTADVSDVAAWLPDVLSWLDGEPLALLWASPPCQDWSSAGGRAGASGERNGWPWTWAAVDALRAAGVRVGALVAENVMGMTHHSKETCGDVMACPGCYLDGVVMADAAHRFEHSGRWACDAADYGVPQHRRRIFVWGAGRDVAPPARTHHPTGGMFRPWWVGAGDAGVASAVIRAECTGATGRAASSPSPSVTGAGNLYGYALQPGVRGKPSPTVTATEGKGCATDSRRASRAFGRRLTVEECAILQGWPEAAESSYRIVGNAVPPALAQAVGGCFVGC